MVTKILIAAALVMGLSFSTVAFAENPKTDDAKKDAKTEVKASPTENEGAVRTKDATFTYFVLSETTVNGIPKYQVTTQDQGCPDQGSDPCKIESNEEMDSQGLINQSAVTQVLLHRE